MSASAQLPIFWRARYRMQYGIYTVRARALFLYLLLHTEL